MATWKSGVMVAAIAGVGFGPVAQGQIHAERTPRAMEYSGRGSEIGVSVRDVEPESNKPANAPVSGVLITDVMTDSPAAKAGIKNGDVVVEFDGERVRSVRQFTRVVQETPPGRKVAAVLTREGQRVNVTVEPRAANAIRLLGDLANGRAMEDLQRRFGDAFPVPPPPPAAPDAPDSPPSPPAPPMFPDVQTFIWRSDSGLGLTVTSLSSQLAEYFGTKHGVLVTAVRDDSAAHAAGFKAGDVVTAINGADISDPSDLRRRTQDLQTGAEFSAEVMRDKKPMTLKGKIERRAARGGTRVSL
jgi:serine protease Do